MSEKKLVWLAAYTLPKTEKRAYEKLRLIGVNAYLPLYEKLQVWSDRKKKIAFPLFPNYIFVQTTLAHRFQPLQLKELVRYISFGGEIVQVRESEIEVIRKIAEGAKGEVNIRNHAFDRKGLAVKVVRGPMAGLRGIVEHSRGKDRLLINIHSLRQIISLEVTADMLAKDEIPASVSGRYTYPMY